MKKFLFAICIIASLTSCSCSSSDDVMKNPDEFTSLEVIDTLSSDFHYQYNIKWKNINESPVDVRTLTIKGHEYIIANSYIGRGGSTDIEHSASCPNHIHDNKQEQDN